MKKLYPYLTYAGSIPFIFCAFCLVLDRTTLPILGDVQHILSVYGLAIAAFMAGSHWGQHLTLKDGWSLSLPIVSNVITILLWLGFLLLSFQLLLGAFVIAFLILLALDHKLHQQSLISTDYFRTRCFVTLIVVTMLILSGSVA